MTRLPVSATSVAAEKLERLERENERLRENDRVLREMVDDRDRKLRELGYVAARYCSVTDDERDHYRFLAAGRKRAMAKLDGAANDVGRLAVKWAGKYGDTMRRLDSLDDAAAHIVKQHDSLRQERNKARKERDEARAEVESIRGSLGEWKADCESLRAEVERLKAERDTCGECGEPILCEECDRRIFASASGPAGRPTGRDRGLE